MSKEDTRRLLATAVHDVRAGISQLVFVTQGKFTPNQIEMFHEVEQAFGGGVIKFVTILYTHFPQHDEK